MHLFDVWINVNDRVPDKLRVASGGRGCALGMRQPSGSFQSLSVLTYCWISVQVATS